MNNIPTLADLYTVLGLEIPRNTEFKPYASYNRYLDWLIWLDEDVSYVSRPVHPGLETLHHPEDNRVIGFKILGAKKLLEAISGTQASD